MRRGLWRGGGNDDLKPRLLWDGLWVFASSCTHIVSVLSERLSIYIALVVPGNVRMGLYGPKKGR
jgi:hypothetical protein